MRQRRLRAVAVVAIRVAKRKCATREVAVPVAVRSTANAAKIGVEKSVRRINPRRILIKRRIQKKISRLLRRSIYRIKSKNFNVRSRDFCGCADTVVFRLATVCEKSLRVVFRDVLLDEGRVSFGAFFWSFRRTGRKCLKAGSFIDGICAEIASDGSTMPISSRGKIGDDGVLSVF